MIRIFKDNDVKVVTNGAYKQLYKPLGYKPIIEEKKSKVVVQKQEEAKTEEINSGDNTEIKESSRPKRKRGE